MSKSMIAVEHRSPQVVIGGMPISLGSVIRRFGCDIAYNNGTIITEKSVGYYMINVNASFTPAATGLFTMSVLENGVVIGRVTSSGTIAETASVNLAGLPSRVACCMAKNISVQFDTEGTVSDLLVSVVKV